MARARRTCNQCGRTIDAGQARCADCTRQAERTRRPDGNPYNTKGHQHFREAVLTRDPICVICQLSLATVADHWPIERRDLVAQGLDPDDPSRGRGLCGRCHSRHTAATEAGGWHRDRG